MRGLLSVSFGTSHADTRARTIDAIEEKLRAQFPAWVFYSAWTSKFIVAKVRKRGEHHDTLDEALERLSADGVDDLVVSTTCLLDGEEMRKVAQAVEAWAAKGGVPTRLAAPLLTSPHDRREVARIVAEEFSSLGVEDALLLMGHGSAEADNGVYADVQRAFRELGHENFFVATVEGEPTLDDALPLLHQRHAARVYLAPLMIVAGDHAKNDLAGDGPHSWASRLTEAGFQVAPVLKGLGEYAGIQQLVCNHVEDALTIREVGLRG